MTLPKHLFVSECDGHLYDTRVSGWHKLPPLRANYERPHREIDSVADLKAVLRSGQYTFPGCYPLYFIASDGEVLSFKAVRQELRQIMSAIENRCDDGWRVVACEINYEDADLRCAHTDERIESAYAEVE